MALGIQMCSFKFLASLIAAASSALLLGCGGPTPADPPGPLRVGSWNILRAESAWTSDWGCPIEIEVCEGRQEECTVSRFARLWAKIESLSGELDVLLLQEADAQFMAALSESSHWEETAISGMCVVLRSTKSSFKVRETMNLAIPDLSTCGAAAPAAVLERDDGAVAAVLAVHAHHELPKEAIYNWTQIAIETFVAALPDDAVASAVIGGDFNKNLTEFQLDPTWQATKGNLARGNIGDFTANDNFGDIGDIDGFLTTMPFAAYTIHVAGMMPKHVKDFVQRGEMQTEGRFTVSDDRESVFYQVAPGSPVEPVPNSNPRTETLSDHLLVTAEFDLSGQERVMAV